MYRSGSLKSFVDLLAWCCFAAMYSRPRLPQEEVSVTIFTVKKGMSSHERVYFLLNSSTLTCLPLPAAGKSELRAVSMWEVHLCVFLPQDGAAGSLSALLKCRARAAWCRSTTTDFPLTFQPGRMNNHTVMQRQKRNICECWHLWMGTMYNSFGRSKTISVRTCHQHLTDSITLNPLLMWGAVCPGRQLNGRKMNPCV